MNSLPYLKLLISELVSRDCAYAPVLADIEILIAQGVYSGAISRRVYLRMAGYQIEGLDEKESPDIAQEIDNSLAASQVCCVGRDPGAHEEISRLRKKLKLVSG
jgi:hypothetical protein